ncbi:MAG TPA: nitrilase-related carbon-nitrogen hydrolase [Bacteroidota bacterium]|nr:nitrilase-related carbon-nitrogen hydrolase [Bacteroidota bacterium]
MKFKLAVAQVDSAVGNLEANLKQHLELIDKARSLGANLIVFPELSLTGYTLRDLAWEVAVNPFADLRLSPLRDASKSVSVAFGMVESGENHGIYNSAVFLEDGLIKHIHRKIYPPTYGMFEEGRYFSQGRDVCAFDSKHGRFGLLVCEDLWHVSLPYLLALDGAEVIFSLTASPTRVATGSAELEAARVNHEQHRAYARLLSSYLVFSNRVGYEDGVNFWGGSSVVSPGGATISSAKMFEPDLIFAEVNSLEVERARRFSRHFLDEDPALVEETLKRIRRTRSTRSSENPT